MKKIKLILFVLIGFYNWLSAQPVNESSGTVGQVSIRFNQIVGTNLNYIFKEIGSPVDNHNLKINAFSSDIIGNYFIKENTSLRLRLGYNNNSFKIRSKVNFSGGDINSFRADYKQTTLTFSPGLSNHLKNDKLTFTLGFELPIDIIGKSKLTAENNYYDSFNNTYDIYTVDASLDGGIAFGLGAFLGAGYMVFNHFSLGTEFSYGFKYVNVGGNLKIETYDNGILDIQQTDELKIRGFTMIPFKASLILSYSF